MNSRSFESGIRTLKSGLLFLLLATPAFAQWRFEAGYAPMVGLKSEFSGFGNFTIPAPINPLSPAGTFTYLDGFVGVDSTGNVGDLTSFWSYTNATQAVASRIEMRSLSSSLVNAGSTAESGIAAAAGFEMSGYRHLAAVHLPFETAAEASWGLRIGFQYNRVDNTNSAAISASVGTITDSYVPGLILPAPYVGPFLALGPVPLLDVSTGGVDSPTRTLGTANAAITGTRNFDVHLNILQFGSYLDIPISEKFDAMLEGGALLGFATGSYDFISTVTIPGLGAQTTTGSTSRTRILPGAYIGLGLRYGLTQRLSLQASVRYQLMRPFEMTANGSTAKLNINSAVTLSAGLVWRF